MTAAPRCSGRRPAWLLTALVTALAGCSSAAGPTATAGGEAPVARPASFEIGPGAILAGAPPTVYLMPPAGGVEAVAAASGEVLWTSRQPGRPLAATADWLLVQRPPAGGPGSLPLAFLDAADGHLIAAPFDVPLPPEVWPVIEETPEVSFDVAAAWEDGQLSISWTYLERWPTGVAPPIGRPPFRHRDEGAFRLDPDSRRTMPVAPEAAVPPDLPPAVAELLARGGLARPPWRVGGLLASARVEPDGAGGRRVVLERWRAEDGRPLAAKVLAAGAVVAHLPSADRRHLLVVRAPDAAAQRAGRYRWSIFGLAEGDPVAELVNASSATPFCVVGGFLLHIASPRGLRVGDRWREEPRRLRAVTLADGDERWQRPLRDLSYRGPRPPATTPTTPRDSTHPAGPPGS